MQYRCSGEIHRDFHASVLDGVNYLIDNFGEEAARKVLRRTATEVYRTMHEGLQRGDRTELLEWWRYYLDREGGKYRLEETSDGAILTVESCPAQTHLANRGIPGGKRTCWATRILNEALCEDSPYEIVLEETGESSCRQVLRKKANLRHS